MELPRACSWRVLLIDATVLVLALCPCAVGQSNPPAQRPPAAGKPLVVTIGATKKPIIEFLAEMESATGVPIDRAAVPSEAIATLAPGTLSLWDVVNQLCRANGKLMWDVAEGGIVIRKEPFAAPSLATNGGYGILFRGFQPDPEEGGEHVASRAFVIGPPGTIVAVHYLTYSELVDDKGTNLLKSGGGAGGGMTLVSQSTFGNPDRLSAADPSRPFYDSPEDFVKAVPGRGATKVKSCKGVAVVRAIAEMKKTLQIGGADLKQGARVKAGDAALEIESIDVSGQSVTLALAITDPRRGVKDRTSFYPEKAGRLVLRDTAGAELQDLTVKPTTGSATLGSGGGGSETVQYEVTGRLGGAAKLAAVELWDPGKIDEVKIPFVSRTCPSCLQSEEDGACSSRSS